MKNYLLLLLFLLINILNVKSQSNASSTGSGMDWYIQSGAFNSSPSKIVLDGDGTVGGSVLIQSDAGTGGIGRITLNSNNGGNIYFNTSNSTKMTLLNNGNLEVNGTIRASTFIGDGSQLTTIPFWKKDSNGDVYYSNPNNSGIVKIGVSYCGPLWSGADWSGLYMNYTFGQHVLRGKLVIKNIPSFMAGGLDVDGDITSTGVISGSLVGSGAIYSNSDPNYALTYLKTWGLHGSGTIYIEPGPGSDLYLTDSWRRTGMLNVQFGKTVFESGNVSIGTTSIRRQLTIGGNTRPYMSFYPTTTNHEFVVGSDENGFIIYDGTVSSNQYRMIIDYNGNIGIGCTDTKGYKLAVNGSMVATRVMVKLQSDWPDFVFSSNYKVRSLTEVENYIKEYKHLPDVPTQEEVKDGVDVGEMNRILLKKIEEMTLLMIEQNKKIEMLSSEIESMKNR